MIPPVLDLGHVSARDLPLLPGDLRGATYPVPFHHLCPFCAVKPAGLLQGHCGDADCRTQFLDADRAYERAADQ